MNELFAIAGHFIDPKTIGNIEPLGNGLINDTYRIMVDGRPKYVLQRINNAVFTDVDMLQSNIEAVTNHIKKKYESQGVNDVNRRVLHFLKADTGNTYVVENEKYWRVMDFIADSYTYEAVTPEYAYFAGRSFGDFESLLSDFVLFRFITQMTCFAAPFLLLMLTRNGSLDTRLKVFCAAIAAEEIAGDIFFLLVRLSGSDDHETISLFHTSGEYQTNIWDWLLYFAVNILLYCLIYRLFRFNQYEELDKESRRPTLGLTVFCILALSIPDCVRSVVPEDSSLMPLFYRFYLITVAVLVLFYCRQIAFHSRYRTEKAIIDQVLSEERKQYQQLKENIDVINARCHDLKHQLDDFSGKLTEQEVSELRNAMEFYDSNIKTGNEVLDVVLRLSQLSCEKEHIQLSCLADGACLSFMRTRHVYSLFNNALNNAIEAVKKLPDEEKKVISVSVINHGKFAEIEVTNYFDGTLPSPGDTSKGDRNHHGFGTISMRYIAEEYSGHLSIQTQKDIYTLRISIPFQN